MAEVNEYLFSFQEVVEALIKKQDIHEGLWTLNLRFGLTAINLAAGPGAPLTPAAIIPVQSIGIAKAEEPTNLTVDAAQVNPAPKASGKETGTKATK